MFMRLSAISFACAIAATNFVTACGDFGNAEICLPNADPSCDRPARQNSGPFLNGPNPNYPDPNNAPPALDVGDGASAPAARSPLAINEVLLNPNGPNAGFQKLELANLDGANAVDLSGYRVAFSDSEADYTFGTGTMLGANGFLVLHIGQFGKDDASNAYLGDLSELKASHGSIALISPEGAIVSFVQYGSTGNRYELEASNDGVWTKGSTCELPIEGTSLSAYPEFGPASKGMWAQYPSLGEVNPMPLNRD